MMERAEEDERTNLNTLSAGTKQFDDPLFKPKEKGFDDPLFKTKGLVDPLSNPRGETRIFSSKGGTNA